MSECFQHIDLFIDSLIDYIEECIKKIYDDSIFNRKKYEKKSPKPASNGFNKEINTDIEEDREWDIV